MNPICASSKWKIGSVITGIISVLILIIGVILYFTNNITQIDGGLMTLGALFFVVISTILAAKAYNL